MRTHSFIWLSRAFACIIGCTIVFSISCKRDNLSIKPEQEEKEPEKETNVELPDADKFFMITPDNIWGDISKGVDTVFVTDISTYIGEIEAVWGDVRESCYKNRLKRDRIFTYSDSRFTLTQTDTSSYHLKVGPMPDSSSAMIEIHLYPYKDKSYCFTDFTCYLKR